MTLRHLRIFIQVVKSGSVTAAAKALYLAQPAVSQAIRELEDLLGVRLFDRMSKKLYITESGKKLYAYAVSVMDLLEEMQHTVTDTQNAGVLRVGASITIGTHYMPTLVKQFAAAHPNADVRVLVSSSETIENKVLDNELDFALIEGIAHAPQLEKWEWMQDKLVAVCCPSHPLLLQQPVSLEQLASAPLLLREKGSGTRELFDALLRTHNCKVTPKWESTSTHALINAVREGLGVSVLPYRLIEHELQSGQISCLTTNGFSLKRSYVLIRHKNKHLSPLMQAFIKMLKDKKAAD